jgi:hypothetical protein
VHSYLLRVTVHLPLEFVTTVVPFGPLVEPLTWPLPAVIEVDKPPAEARPLCVVTTLQFDPLAPPETTVLLEPPELLPTLTELLELCASTGAAPRLKTATDTRKVFMVDLH